MRDWKRYEATLVARRSGKTLKEVGASLGVSGNRAMQMQRVMLLKIYRGLAPHLLPLSEAEERTAKEMARRYPDFGF